MIRTLTLVSYTFFIFLEAYCTLKNHFTENACQHATNFSILIIGTEKSLKLVQIQHSLLKNMEDRLKRDIIVLYRQSKFCGWIKFFIFYLTYPGTLFTEYTANLKPCGNKCILIREEVTATTIIRIHKRYNFLYNYRIYLWLKSCYSKICRLCSHLKRKNVILFSRF